jgi:hypothetical protein
MKPVKQTKRGARDAPPEERGDCMDAAVASILELPLERVRIAHNDDEHWWVTTQKALNPLGWAMVTADARVYPYSLTGPPVYWLASVPSLNLRGETHMIVMANDQVAHDPSMGESIEVGTLIGDLKVSAAYVLVPISYA